MKSYTILLWPDLDEGGFTVTVPSMPGCVTEGDTLDEALDNARDAIETYLEGLIKHGEPIPDEDVRPQLLTIEVA